MTIQIQGEAGAGKSWLINKLKEKFPKINTGSTTWVSGLLINSPTYYLNLRLKVNFEREPIKPPLTKRQKYNTVIIDEASMLSKAKLNWLQKSYPTYTFILVGDWNQLPPVNEEPISENQIDMEIQLTGQYRQNDINYYSFIQRYLDNKLTDFDRQQIKSRTITREEAIASNDMILCFHNSYYDNEGMRTSNGRLDYIEKRMEHTMTSKHTPNTKLISKVYYESDTGKRIFPKRKDWLNNEIFTVKERHKNYIILKNERTEFPVTYEELKFFDRADALTIHKIQGQTIEENIIVDLDSIWKADKNIIPRLIYVALSRVRKWEQIRFIGNLNNPFMSRVSFKNPLILDNNKLLNEFLLLSNFNCLYKNNLVVLATNNILMFAAKTTKINPEFKYKITQKEFIFLTGTTKQNVRHYNSISEAWEKFLIKLEKVTNFVTINRDKKCNLSNKNIKTNTDEEFGTVMREFVIKDKEGKDVMVYKVADNPNQYDYYITINKLKEGSTTAKDENVETYRNFVFEIDNEDINIQRERAKKLVEQGVVNRVVDSAGKSIHCRITIEDEPTNKEEYKYIWNKLNKKYFDEKSDTTLKNPATLTRKSLGIRTKWKNKNGNIEIREPKEQKRLFLNNNKLVYNWREDYEKDKMVEDWLLQFYNHNTIHSNITLEKIKKWNNSLEVKKLLNNDFIDGERHKMIPKAIKFLFYKGISKNEVYELVKRTGIRDWKSLVDCCYKN
jgi:hypothetical protein